MNKDRDAQFVQALEDLPADLLTDLYSDEEVAEMLRDDGIDPDRIAQMARDTVRQASGQDADVIAISPPPSIRDENRGTPARGSGWLLVAAVAVVSAVGAGTAMWFLRAERDQVEQAKSAQVQHEHNSVVVAAKNVGKLIKAANDADDPTELMEAAEALTDPELATEQLRGDAQELWLRGYRAFEHKEYEKALGLFERALEIDPRYYPAMNTAGRALAHLGRREDAEARFRTVLTIRPDYLPSLQNLATILVTDGRLDDAEPLIEKAESLDPGNTVTARLRKQLERRRSP